MPRTERVVNDEVVTTDTTRETLQVLSDQKSAIETAKAEAIAKASEPFDEILSTINRKIDLLT